jgi:response regulator of citrate/malate metabolism
LDTDKKKVLIVDDSKTCAEVLRIILQKFPDISQIDVVHDTDEAYALISKDQKHFDLLFVDYHFSGVETGEDLLAQLNKKGLLNDKASFLITFEPEPLNLHEAVKNSICGMIAKPFDRKQITLQLEKAFRYFEIKDTESFSFD